MVSVLGTRDGSLSSQITSTLCLVRRIVTSNSGRKAIFSGTRNLTLFTDLPSCYTKHAKMQQRKSSRSVCPARIDTRPCLKRGLTLSGHVLLSVILHALQRVRPLLRQSLVTHHCNIHAKALGTVLSARATVRNGSIQAYFVELILVWRCCSGNGAAICNIRIAKCKRPTGWYLQVVTVFFSEFRAS